MLLSPLTFDGNDINDTNTVSRFMMAGSYPVSVIIQSQQRRNSTPLLNSLLINGRTLPLLVRRKSTGTKTSAAWNSDTKQWFDPGKGRVGERYLTLTGDDGSTTLRIACHVQSIEPHSRIVDAYVVTLTCVNPYFEANALTTSAANPATVINAGNVAVAPTLELTHATHVTRRACTVAGVGAGGGLLRTPVLFELSAVAATATNVFVFVEGVSVPCVVENPGLSTSRVWALIDTASDGTATTAVDIIYGAGLVNPLCGILALGSLSLSVSPNVYSNNTQWVWGRTGAPDWTISDDAQIPGLWQPARTGNHNFSAQGTYAIGSESTTSIRFDAVEHTHASAPLDNSADSMQVIIGAAVFSTLANFQRVLSFATSGVVRAYVRYRVAGSASWVTAWSATASATVTTSITITNAVQIVAGLEMIGTLGAAGAYTAQFNSNSTSGAAVGKSVASRPTVTVSAAQNMDLYSGTITIGAYVITFDNVMVRDGTLILDTGNRTISSSVADSPVYGSFSFSDPSVIALLESGSNAVAHTTGGSLVVKHRAGYS